LVILVMMKKIKKECLMIMVRTGTDNLWEKILILRWLNQSYYIITMRRLTIGHINMKYNEDKIIKEISDYISNTYTEHYSTTKDGFQVQDMLRHLGIDKDFCQANAIKYLARYGKKNGKNRKDLLKAIHYVVLLMSSEDNNKEDTNE